MFDFSRQTEHPTLCHTHHLDNKATYTRATRHGGPVTTNSRAEHSNEKCTVHKERDTTLNFNELARICSSTFSDCR